MLLDQIVNFNMAFYDKGVLVVKKKSIAKNYLKLNINYI